MRHRMAVGAAALSVACFGLMVLTPARADDSTLEVYTAGGVGDGVATTFAIRPSIFDPLLQAGALHTEAAFDSQGEGRANSLASQVFPGTFFVGALRGQIGCSSIPGSPWVTGSYPPAPTCPKEQSSALLQSQSALAPTFGPTQVQDVFKTVRDHVGFNSGAMRATTDLGTAGAFVRADDFELRSGKDAPIISALDFDVENTGALRGSDVRHSVKVVASGVSIFGGLITIDSIVSEVRAASDGHAGSAEAASTISGVKMLIGGTPREARITSEGIHITDPKLSHGQRLAINETIREELLRAGVRIVAASPSRIVDESSAEASAPGLLVSFTAAAPPVAVPRALAPYLATILEEIDTQCLFELTEPIPGAPALPLCFGSGVLPGSNSPVNLSLSIASASAYASGATIPRFDFIPPADPRDFGGTDVLGVQFTNEDTFDPGPTILPPATPGRRPEVTPTLPLFGLVANMPSTGLAIAGAFFLVLAIGMALGPSLRHAGAR